MIGVNKTKMAPSSVYVYHATESGVHFELEPPYASSRECRHDVDYSTQDDEISMPIAGALHVVVNDAKRGAHEYNVQYDLRERDVEKAAASSTTTYTERDMRAHAHVARILEQESPLSRSETASGLITQTMRVSSSLGPRELTLRFRRDRSGRADRVAYRGMSETEAVGAGADTYDVSAGQQSLRNAFANHQANVAAQRKKSLEPWFKAAAQSGGGTHFQNYDLSKPAPVAFLHAPM